MPYVHRGSNFRVLISCDHTKLLITKNNCNIQIIFKTAEDESVVISITFTWLFKNPRPQSTASIFGDLVNFCFVQSLSVKYDISSSIHKSVRAIFCTFAGRIATAITRYNNILVLVLIQNLTLQIKTKCETRARVVCKISTNK